MRRHTLSKFAGVLAVAAVFIQSAPLVFGSIVMNLDSVITGDAPAASSLPWLTAQFDTQGQYVKFTLSAPNLSNAENVKEWLFNIDPAVTKAQLDTLQIVSITKTAGKFDITSISLIKMAVAGVTRAGFSFDFDFGFPEGNPINRFSQGDTVEIVVSSSLLDLTEGMFNYFDATGTYRSAAHIQQTGLTGTGSGWIGTTPVPEPTTIIAGALLLLPFGASTIRILRGNRKA